MSNYNFDLFFIDKQKRARACKNGRGQRFLPMTAREIAQVKRLAVRARRGRLTCKNRAVLRLCATQPDSVTRGLALAIRSGAVLPHFDLFTCQDDDANEAPGHRRDAAGAAAPAAR